MRPTTYCRLVKFFFECAFFVLSLTVASAWINGGSGALGPTAPNYVLRLDLNEFSILNVSAMDDLTKYGGSVDLALTMNHDGNRIAWTVTLTNAVLLDALNIHVAQKAVKLIQSLDPLNLDTNSRIALLAIKSLTEKMDYARRNPEWDLVSLPGYVTQNQTNWVLNSEHGLFQLVGANLDALKWSNGTGIIASGYVKVPGQLEMVRFLEKKSHTLELFVMSHCPFGQRAGIALLDFLDKMTNTVKPTLQVRYIFYQNRAGDKEIFTALHGEDEVRENLAQIILRDHYPQVFPVYLRQRSRCVHQPFEQVAVQAGLAVSDIAAIEQTITRERETLIQREYDYAVGKHGILDGSPTYVWEGVKVADLRTVEAFKSLPDTPNGRCAD